MREADAMLPRDLAAVPLSMSAVFVGKCIFTDEARQTVHFINVPFKMGKSRVPFFSTSSGSGECDVIESHEIANKIKDRADARIYAPDMERRASSQTFHRLPVSAAVSC